MTIAFVYTSIIILGIFFTASNIKRVFFGLFAFLASFEVNKITASALMIGSQEIRCTDIILAALFFCSIALLFKKQHVKKPLVLCGLLVITLGFLSYAFNVFCPYNGLTIPADGSWDGLLYGTDRLRTAVINGRSYLIMLRLFIFVIVAWCASGVLTCKDFLDVGNYAVAFGKVQIAFGLFEFLTKKFLHSTIAMRISSAVFPAFSSYVSTILDRGGIVALQGFGREPSHFAFAVSFTLLVLILLRVNGRKGMHDSAWALLGLFLLIMSGAFTAMVGLCLISFVCIFYIRKGVLLTDGSHRACAYLLIIAAVGCGVVYLSVTQAVNGNYYYEKMVGVFSNVDQILQRHYGSSLTTYDAMPRIVSMVECFRVFLERPLLGIGPGVVDPFSGLSAILSQYGLPFSIVWFIFLWTYSKAIDEKASSVLFICVVFFTGLLLFGGGYEYSFLWLLFGGLLKDEGFCSESQNMASVVNRLVSND